MLHPTPRPTARRVSLLAVGVSSLIALASCSSSSTTTASPIVSDAPIVTAIAPTPTAATAPSAAAISTQAPAPAPPGPPDLPTLLSPYTGGYSFSTTVLVNGQLAVKADGRRVADATAMTILGNGIPVDMIITPAGTWARQQGDEWVLTEAAASPADPLGLLRSPVSTTTNADGTLAAIYPAELFGLPAGPMSVRLTPVEGRLGQIRYETTASGQPTVIETSFSPLGDTTVITAPA